MSRSSEKTASYIERLLPKVINSEEKSVDFDPNYIYQSLMKETGVNPSIASKLTETLTRRLIGSHAKSLTSPMIRELVCSLLVEEGLEKERYHYTRLGLPYKDFEELITPLKAMDKELPFHEIEAFLERETIAKKVCEQVFREFAGINQIMTKILKE